jgi:hypothetical protein
MDVYTSLTDRLKTQHEAIPKIISTTNSNQLLVRPQPDNWNIVDNIAHLTRYQEVFIERINQILIQQEPYFGRYSADEDPEFEKFRSINTGPLIKQINKDRNAIYNLVTGISGKQLNRCGVHKKFGSLNVIQWTEFFLLHEAHHIFTIFQLSHDSALM